MYTIDNLECAEAAFRRVKVTGNSLLLWPMDIEIAIYAIECMIAEKYKRQFFERDISLRKKARLRVLQNSNSHAWITSKGTVYSKMVCSIDAAIEEEMCYLKGITK